MAKKQPAGKAPAGSGHRLNRTLTPREARVLAAVGKGKKAPAPPKT